MKPRQWWFWATALFFLCLWGVSGPAEVYAAPQVQDELVTHVVERGETLFSIAQRYETTVAAIAAANAISDPSYIEVGQELVIPIGTVPGPVPGQAAAGGETQLAKYLVVPGDTLDLVARRFQTTTLSLATLNGAVNPLALSVGEQLVVPAESTRRVHQVTESETAVGLALRYDRPLWAFLVENQISSPAALVAGERVWVPSPVTTGTLASPFVDLDVGPAPIIQGHTFRVRVELDSDGPLRGVFDDQMLHFFAEQDAHYALIGINALTEPGTYTLALAASDVAGDQVYTSRGVRVTAGDYGYEEIILGDDRDALLDPAALAAERERLAGLKSTFTDERYWEGLFRRPIDTELTSFFGTRRLYKSPSYQFTGYHEGTDFNGVVGDPVYAPAAGVVVLAEQLYVRGGAVVIDHGWGIYTGYWHLSQIDVEVGQRVEPGDPIALVGHTGLSTGAHLHWDFWVNGTNVSALQWTDQIFP
jgi:murein DD-endopeptidase MepM/ murein hydrolase activator NlpD